MTPGEIRKFAEKHGVFFESQGSTKDGGWVIECWAPDGQVWRESGTHFLSLPGDGWYTQPVWPDVMTRLKESIQYGFDDCLEDDCDVCE